jgi:hypothetical protein
VHLDGEGEAEGRSMELLAPLLINPPLGGDLVGASVRVVVGVVGVGDGA